MSTFTMKLASGIILAFGSSVLATSARLHTGAALGEVEHWSNTVGDLLNRPHPAAGKVDPKTDCDELYYDQPVDHFNYNDGRTYKQRYFSCKPEYWSEGGPIFFYTGNEASVELYVNNTGIMWENAQEFGAWMVFAEHRFFGKSWPFSEKEATKHYQYCTTDQALSDFAELIYHLKEEKKSQKSAVISFGGSYGGMLTYWMRLKYPGLVDGALAGSAPLLGYLGDTVEPDDEAFNRVVTLDATSKGFAADSCAVNMQRGWRKIFEMGGSKESCATLTHLFKRCEDSEIKTFEDAKALATWVSAAVVNIAMGSFPYPSAYLLNGKGMLPAYPVAAACRFVEGERTDMEIVEGLMTGLTQMYYNNTGDKTCFSTKDTGAFSGSAWDYLACSEVILASAQDGIRDMFWNAPFDREAMRKDCLEQYGSHTKFDVGSIKYGGRKAMRATSNVIFTNGELDPWIAEGVLQDVTDTVVSIIIPKAGHHEDLMFSTKDDPPALTDARERILVHIRRWIDEVTEAYEEPFISTNIAKKMWIWDKEEI